jgi:hypothetical protein
VVARREAGGMNSLTHISPRFTAVTAMAAGVAIGVLGMINLVDEQSSETTTVGIEHVSLAGLTAGLILLVPVVLLLARVAGRPRLAAIPLTGMLGLAALTVISNVRGEDPSFFGAVAVPTNLLWFGGFVALAVALRRSGRVPQALAIALPITWFLSLPGSNIGLSVVAGAYWIVVGWLVLHDQLEIRAGHRAELATA